MSKENRVSVRDQTLAVLRELSEAERTLLSRVLRIERDHLHQLQPQLKDDLLRAVREVYK
jgi:hypothetical protein